MNNHKGWIETKRKAADPEPAPVPAPAAEPAPAQVPLGDADKNRQPPPPNPTGNPEPAKPMSLSEVLRLLEGAGKSMLDAGLDHEKASSSLLKVRTMAGMTPQEREIMQKSSEFAAKISSMKQEGAAIAKAISDYRDSLASKGTQGWLASK
jgi:hypothetical protein